MKVILYMAITVNGYIATCDDDTSWISLEEWNIYSELSQKIGNIIVGHRTYDIFTKQPEFQELAKAKFVVVSNQNVKTISKLHSVAKSPKEALDIFKDEEEVIVAGGGNLNSSFMKEGLVDEIYLDVEPLVLGKGIQVFKPEDFEYELELLELKQITKNLIQLHYKVKK